MSNLNKTLTQHKFSEVPSINVPRSKHFMPHSHLTTVDSGYLVPIFAQEYIPGSTIQLDTSIFGRLTTQVLPIMDNVYIDVHWFAVPHRLLWDNFKRFMGERPNPNDSIDFVIPQITMTSAVSSGSIWDYLQLPKGVTGYKFNALIPRAYNLIYNTHFRDQNLINQVPFVTGDTDSLTNYTLLKRGKRHDYFTSCLPHPQKGDAIKIPLGTTAPVKSASTDQSLLFKDINGAGQGIYATTSPMGGAVARSETGNAGNTWSSNMVADLANAVQASVTAMRTAVQLQRLLEKDARGGTRYHENVQVHYGVTNPDSRMQRPEFIGMSTTMLNQSIVPQTSGTGISGSTPQGTLTAYSTFADNSKFTYSTTEHIIIMGIASIRTDMRYQYGLDKKWSRQTRYDYPLPVLDHLGEQPVLNKEIYCQGSSADNDVFGYQEAWADWRSRQSKISGRMNSADSLTLDSWHCAQRFTSLPVLNQQFIEESPAIKRSLAVQNQPEFYLDCYFKEYNTIPLSAYSVPGYMDHF